MSAPSGIKVPDDLKSAFSSALGDATDVRALVFVIEGETFKHLTSIKPRSSYNDDIALLAPALPSPKTPASFAYRLDSKAGGKYEWMMVTYVPDDAGVRAKMLQASSRAGLLKALGANNFKHDWFATNINDLTPASLKAHLNHLSSPPPLSASEAALAEVREAEAAEAKRVALDPEAEARRRRAVVGLGGKFKWGDGVADALDKVGERSDDGWIVCLEIPASDTSAVHLVKSEACTPSQLASKLPPKSPCYTFYAYPTPPPPTPAPAPAPAEPAKAPMSAPRNTFQASQGGVRVVQASDAPQADEAEATEKDAKEGEADVADLSLKEGEEKQESPEVVSPSTTTTAPPAKTKGRVLFIYTCPSGSPVKFRMVYSSGVRGMQQDAMDKAEVEITAKLETSDISDLTESYLKSSIPSKPTHASSLPTPSKSAFGAPASSTSSSRFTGGPVFGAPAPVFGAPAPAFGRPRPTPSLSTTSASQIPLPASPAPATPVSADEGGDNKESIRKAFEAFGPRVGGGGGGGGFARPRPAGKR